MKRALALTALLMVFCAVLINGQNLTSSILNNNSGPRICVLANCNYYAVNPVCGRFGRSNLCKRFNNSCLLRYETCVSSVTYTTVSTSMCSGIPVGSRRRCSGSSSSSSNVVPIYIGRSSG